MDGANRDENIDFFMAVGERDSPRHLMSRCVVSRASTTVVMVAHTTAKNDHVKHGPLKNARAIQK